MVGEFFEGLKSRDTHLSWIRLKKTFLRFILFILALFAVKLAFPAIISLVNDTGLTPEEKFNIFYYSLLYGGLIAFMSFMLADVILIVLSMGKESKTSHSFTHFTETQELGKALPVLNSGRLETALREANETPLENIEKAFLKDGGQLPQYVLHEAAHVLAALRSGLHLERAYVADRSGHVLTHGGNQDLWSDIYTHSAGMIMDGINRNRSKFGVASRDSEYILKVILEGRGWGLIPPDVTDSEIMEECKRRFLNDFNLHREFLLRTAYLLSLNPGMAVMGKDIIRLKGAPNRQVNRVPPS